MLWHTQRVTSGPSHTPIRSPKSAASYLTHSVDLATVPSGQTTGTRVTAVTLRGGIRIDPAQPPPYIRLQGVVMKDIHEVLRRKQAKYAQLAKQIEALQQAAEKLREVAPLLAENEEDDNVVLAEMDDEAGQPSAMAAKASASQGSPAPAKSSRPVAPRWP
jgi:hypothetical protein